jgi:gluconate kinase
MTLDDLDLNEWPLRIEEDMRRIVLFESEAVITCSCLKSCCRKHLTSLGQVQLVWISAPEEAQEQGLAIRDNHFIKPEMLKSHLATFEPISNDEQVIGANETLGPPRLWMR